MTAATTRTRTRLWTRMGAGVLVVLWAAAAIPQTLDAARTVRTHTTTRVLGAPTDAVIVQLQEERRLSAGPPTDVADRDALLAQRARTDEACVRLRDALAGPLRRTAAGATAAGNADDLLRRLEERTRLRETVDGQQPDAGPALAGYTEIIAAAFAGAPWLWPDRSTGTGTALLALARAREALSQQESALLGGSGTAALDGPARAELARLVMTRRVLLAEAAGQLPEASRPGFRALSADPATTRLQAMEDDLIAAVPARRDETGAVWSTVLDEYRNRLRTFEATAVREGAGAAVPGAVATVAGAGLLAGVGLVAVLALLAALRRIPGGAAAPPTAAAGAGPSGTDDTRMLELFLEQNRRNQGLLHRLLRLLDGVQRREDDDSALGELFRVDHLASRVRRNVEKIIALAGGTPGRRWSRPVPLAEVVRAAAAEVAGFERVSTAQVEPAGLAGSAVTDVMHLLAELIENAAAFSPAETRVRVSGRREPGHYVLTVSDHGPGMSEDDLRIAADVLGAAEPPATRAWDGLYTVGRLAGRASAGVQLRNGADGGLLAEVLLPAALLDDGDPHPTAELPVTRPAPPGERVRPAAALATMSADD